MKSSRGFTVIELIVVIVLFLMASVIFFIQKNNVEVAGRDNTRKTAINAIYYSLEEVYFKKNNSYPRVISAEVLPSVDPELFKDPDGVKIGESDSDYRYEASGCTENTCASYSLRADLEYEADYIKENKNK